MSQVVAKPAALDATVGGGEEGGKSPSRKGSLRSIKIPSFRNTKKAVQAALIKGKGGRSESTGRRGRRRSSSSRSLADDDALSVGSRASSVSSLSTMKTAPPLIVAASTTTERKSKSVSPTKSKNVEVVAKKASPSSSSSILSTQTSKTVSTSGSDSLIMSLSKKNLKMVDSGYSMSKGISADNDNASNKTPSVTESFGDDDDISSKKTRSSSAAGSVGGDLTDEDSSKGKAADSDTDSDKDATEPPAATTATRKIDMAAVVAPRAPAITSRDVRKPKTPSSFLTRMPYFRRMCDSAFDVVDTNRSGVIDQKEYFAGLLMIQLHMGSYYGSVAGRPVERESARAAFKEVNADNDGVLNRAEFRHAMAILYGGIVMRTWIIWTATLFIVPIVAQQILFGFDHVAAEATKRGVPEMVEAGTDQLQAGAAMLGEGSQQLAQKALAGMNSIAAEVPGVLQWGAERSGDFVALVATLGALLASLGASASTRFSNLLVAPVIAFVTSFTIIKIIQNLVSIFFMYTEDITTATSKAALTAASGVMSFTSSVSTQAASFLALASTEIGSFLSMASKEIGSFLSIALKELITFSSMASKEIMKFISMVSTKVMNFLSERMEEVPSNVWDSMPLIFVSILLYLTVVPYVMSKIDSLLRRNKTTSKNRAKSTTQEV